MCQTGINFFLTDLKIKITKNGHGRFKYFDNPKESGEKMSHLGMCQNGGLALARLNPTWAEPSETPLNTSEQLKHLETSLNTLDVPLYSQR